MSPERWEQLQSLFNRAVELDGTARAAFLAEACGENAELKIAVEDLLRQDQDAQRKDFLQLISAGASTTEAAASKTGNPPGAEALNKRQAEAPSPGSQSQPTPLRQVKVRCPHCHNPLQLSDQRSTEVLCPACGNNFCMQDSDRTETVSGMRLLGKFQLLERVGLGGFGAVWKARDTELDRVVALKIPHANILASPDGVENVYREARAAARLRHPGIVTVHEVATVGGLPAIVADFIDGVTLRDYIQVRPLSFRESAELIAQLAETLDYAHSMGLIHRDIKPSNIIMDFGRPAAESGSGVAAGTLGKPMLMDFGLALREEAEITRTIDGQVVGTPAYMSPEQAAGRGDQLDRRTDIYSLGVVLYELLCREVPFRGAYQMMLHQLRHEEPRPPRRLNRKIPRDLETICLKAMAKEPAGRYASARDLADDLRRWLRPSGGLIAKHWRGEYSLVRSYWRHGVLLHNFGIQFVFIFLMACGLNLSQGHAALVYIIGTACLVVNLVAWVWVVVGIWRAASKYKGPLIWPILARIAIVFSIVTSIPNTLSTIGAITHAMTSHDDIYVPTRRYQD